MDWLFIWIFNILPFAVCGGYQYSNIFVEYLLPVDI